MSFDHPAYEGGACGVPERGTGGAARSGVLGAVTKFVGRFDGTSATHIEKGRAAFCCFWDLGFHRHLVRVTRVIAVPFVRKTLSSTVVLQWSDSWPWSAALRDRLYGGAQRAGGTPRRVPLGQLRQGWL